MPLVLGGQDRCGARPVDGELGIVPQDTPIMLRRIVFVHLVEDMGMGRQRAEAMGEPLRHEQLPSVLRAEDEALPSPEGRRIPAKIEHDIIDRPLQHPDQLRLSHRIQLIMKPAQGSRFRGHRMIVLHEANRDPVLCEQALVVTFHEEAPIVLEDLGLDQHDAIHLGRNYVHCNQTPIVVY